MYLVFVPRNVMGGYDVEQFEHLDEAKERIKEIVERGRRDVFLAQEIPMKLKVEVEF